MLSPNPIMESGRSDIKPLYSIKKQITFQIKFNNYVKLLLQDNIKIFIKLQYDVWNGFDWLR
jgi:hypothetical protein